jgi:ATP-binding cassette, subfamily B, bacterial
LNSAGLVMKKNIKYGSVYRFLWLNIKPYKWYYFAMLLAPVMSSFYSFANSYSLKLVVDAFSEPGSVTYKSLIWPIAIFVSANILVDVIWRLADIAEWRSEPYVRRSLLTESYSYVQQHSFTYFQNTPGGSITSRIKGILDGYDNFWAAMHHDFSAKLANTIVLTAVIAVVNVQVCLFVSLWVVIFVAIMYGFSRTIDRLSFEYANTKHKVLGLVADNINNIFTIFSFATKKSETNRLREEFSNAAIPANIRFYKFSFWANLVAGILYWIMLISLFLFMNHLRMENIASNGDVVFVMTIALTMSHELWQLIQKMQSFMKNVGDMKSSFEIMKIPHDPKEIEAKKELTIVKPSVSFEHI